MRSSKGIPRGKIKCKKNNEDKVENFDTRIQNTIKSSQQIVRMVMSVQAICTQ